MLILGPARSSSPLPAFQTGWQACPYAELFTSSSENTVPDFSPPRGSCVWGLGWFWNVTKISWGFDDFQHSKYTFTLKWLEVYRETFMATSFVEYICGAPFHLLHCCNPGALQPCQRELQPFLHFDLKMVQLRKFGMAWEHLTLRTLLVHMWHLHVFSHVFEAQVCVPFAHGAYVHASARCLANFCGSKWLTDFRRYWGVYRVWISDRLLQVHPSPDSVVWKASTVRDIGEGRKTSHGFPTARLESSSLTKSALPNPLIELIRKKLICQVGWFWFFFFLW